MIGLIIYCIVSLIVLLIGYKAYISNDEKSNVKTGYVFISLILISILWPLLIVLMILMYVIYKTKIIKNVKDFKHKIDKW